MRALREMEAVGVTEARRESGGGMHSGEQYLIRRLGEDVGGRIHLGRSSGDLGIVTGRIDRRNRLIELMQEINNLRPAVLQVAEQNFDTVMPAYTHSQHAQPTTLAHQLLAWGSILERDFQRADTNYKEINQSGAGAAILTGSNFPLNRQRTAELLGFDSVIKNTFDAFYSQDVYFDLMTVLATVNLNMSRWAIDLNFWFTSEAGYIDIPDRFCGTSSIMMQKKNPEALEDMRGAVADSIGGLVTAYAVMKAATGDVVRDRRYMNDAINRSFEWAMRSLRWLTELLPAVEWKKERMRTMAGSYWAQGTDVAGAMVREKGLPWRTAHQITGILVRFSYERGLMPKDVTCKMLDEAAVEYMGEPVGLSEDALRRALDPMEFVNGRTLYGGPAPEECKRRLVDYHAQLKADVKSVEGRVRRLKEAEEKQEKAIDALLA